MVLVDTSAWIRAFAGREPYFSEVHQLAVGKETVGHDLIYGELLVGDSGGRSGFLKDYEESLRAPAIVHSEVVFLARTRKLHGRGLSWIDVHLLASALAGGHQLYTADDALAETAAELGVAYTPSSSK